MTDAELEALLEELEATLRGEVQAVLDDVSAEYSQALEGATELVAAAFSVSRVRDMWNRRVPKVMTALRRVFRRGSDATADGLDAKAPTDAALKAAADAYASATEPLLRAVGDSLAEAAVRTLADGVNNGDSLEELKARLVTAFNDAGPQLGPGRAQRIAATEATRAFNAGVQAAAEVIAERDDVPVVKQWITRNDERVRVAHREANGQLQLLGDPFDVGGTPMQYPGDPTAPASLTIQCRCIMKATAAVPERAASMGDSDQDFQSRMPAQLKAYWLTGAGAAKIGWGTPGSFERCVRALHDDFPQDTEGLCANLYHEATGRWPGANKGSEYTGAMVALMPSEADAERLSQYTDMPADQIHMTLYYLGQADDWDPVQRAGVVNAMAHASEWLSPVRAEVFGVGLWNPGSDSPCWVWNVGDDRDGAQSRQTLRDVHLEVTYSLEDREHEGPELPGQHSPWAPHVAISYSPDLAEPGVLADACGPVVFDRLRVGFGGEYSDFQLTDQPEREQMDIAEAVPTESPVLAAWSTPGTTALAFENQQTGDGRVFAPGALYWEEPGPWPLMANENFDSHDDASLAGAIHTMSRDGDRLNASGVLYLTQEAGAEAAMLLGQGAPLGVSVDLDDVDLEFVDVVGGRLNACLLHSTTASGGRASEFSETSPTPTDAFVGVVANSFPVESGSPFSTKGGYTQRATHGSSGTAGFRETSAGGAVPRSANGTHGSAPLVAGTRPTSQTGRSDAATTSTGRTGSPLLKPNDSSQSRVVAAQSAKTGSPSSTRTPTGTRHTSTTATVPDGTEPSSANRATQVSASSETGPNYSNELHCTCGSTTEPYRARLVRASLLPAEDGGFVLAGETAPRMTAGGTTLVTEAQRVRFHVGPDGTVPAEAFEIEAAAGDPGTVGTVVDAQRSGDYLMRITRARVRGATLVTIPAYANARIVLDDANLFAPYGLAAAGWNGKQASTETTDYDRVLRHVRRSKVPSGPARIAQYLKIPITAVQRLLARAASRGEVVRLTRGLYTDKTSSAKADHVMMDDLVASVTGAVDLPVAGRDVAWDGAGAESRVFDWADGDTAKLDKAFAWRDDSKDPQNRNSRKLGYCDVIGGELTIVPRGVFAAQAAVNGGRGGVDIPADELSGVKDRLAEVRAHVDEETGAASMDEMQSSAWAALADLPQMPAAWFSEPTVDELPPGAPGVNYANGRIFGWVAQADQPHAGYAKRIVINDLGRIDTTHFLRQRFTLDDGSVVKAGAFTMNAGHHRDGAECETSACQFDDTRTVAGIVTVGMNERGMWFSGAAAPWLSEWDRSVFMATQPSYHMKQGPGGQWQLRAVLAVPVPGHSSPLLATAFVERSNLALTASALMAEVNAAVDKAKAEEAVSLASLTAPEAINYDRLADSLVAAMARAEEAKVREAAELEALLTEARTMDDDTTGSEGA